MYQIVYLHHDTGHDTHSQTFSEIKNNFPNAQNL